MDNLATQEKEHFTPNPTGGKKPLIMPNQYQDWKLPDIEKELTIIQLRFANEYMANGGNAVQAYKQTIWKDKAHKYKGITEKKIASKCGACSKDILRKPLVTAFILKKKEILAEELSKETRFRYATWLNNLHNISEEARTQKQFSAAIRGQEIIGKAAGHIDSNRQDQVSRVSDEELIRTISQAAGVGAAVFAEKLGMKWEDKAPIDGNVTDVTPESDTNTTDLAPSE